MGKVRNKSHDNELNYLRKLNKELEKENRELKRQLKYHEKRQHIVDENKEDLQEYLHEKETKTKEKKQKIVCPNCSKGELKLFDMLDKLYGECNVCDFRRRIK